MEELQVFGSEIDVFAHGLGFYERYRSNLVVLNRCVAAISFFGFGMLNADPSCFSFSFFGFEMALSDLVRFNGEIHLLL